MSTLLRSMLGGALIMVAATLIGVAQNAARSKPMTLFPRITRPAPSPAPATPADEPARASSVSMEAEEAGDHDVTDAELASGEMSKERVKALMHTGKIVLIDARTESKFEEGHIPGAISIPYEKFIDYYDRLMTYAPMSGNVVVYCNNVDCDLGELLADELHLAGYERVMIYKGGYDEWAEVGYPIEGGSEE